MEFQPGEDGTVKLPDGNSLKPMTLYALFQDASEAAVQQVIEEPAAVETVAAETAATEATIVETAAVETAAPETTEGA